MSSRILRRAALAALCLSCVGAMAQAQTLSGRVLDSSGDPVARARLRLECGGTPDPARTVADEHGRFTLPLPVDVDCRLIAQPPDADAPAAESALRATGSTTLEIRLPLAPFHEQIEVRGAPLHAIEGRELRESAARDVGEALSRIPGVEKVRKGGIATDVVVRGLQRDDVEVSIDGQPLHGACPNRMDPPSFHVDFAEVERITLTRGPFDLSSGAPGGSVEILTRRPDPGTSLAADLRVGSSGYLAPSATAAYGGAAWQVQAGAAMRRGDPYEDGTGRRFTELLPVSQPAAYRIDRRDSRAFDVATGWLNTGWTPRAGHRLELAATRQDAGLQLYPYLAMDARFDDATRLRLTYSLADGPGPVDSADMSVGWSRVDHRMDDRLRVSSLAAPREWSMATDADARDLGLRSHVVLRSGWSGGFEARRREWDTTTRMAMSVQPTLAGARFEHTALWAERELRPVDRVSVRLGGRVEHVATRVDPVAANQALYRAFHATTSTSESDLLVSGLASLAWAPSTAWELSARLGSAARPPDPQERYFALRRMGSDWVGNPDLAPSRNTQLDLGALHRGAHGTVEVRAWYSRLDDAITLVDGDRQVAVPGVMNASARTYVNHDARMWGTEAEATMPLPSEMVLSATLSMTRGRRALAPEIGVVDRDLPELPPVSGRLALRWQPSRLWLEGEVDAAARQSRIDAGLQEHPTPGWGVLALRAGTSLGRIELSAAVENLLDHAYSEHLSYQRDPFRSGVVVPEPGRTLVLALRFRS